MTKPLPDHSACPQTTPSMLAVGKAQHTVEEKGERIRYFLLTILDNPPYLSVDYQLQAN
jgi:hypothetical protein